MCIRDRYKELPDKQYKNLMHQKLEKRRVEVIEKLVEKKPNLRFMTKGELRKVRPGSRPKKSKKGSRRPLVLSKCRRARKVYLDWYFDKVRQFKEACEKYRKGDFSVVFPLGTYRPPGIAVLIT